MLMVTTLQDGCPFLGGTTHCSFPFTAQQQAQREISEEEKVVLDKGVAARQKEKATQMNQKA